MVMNNNKLLERLNEHINKNSTLLNNVIKEIKENIEIYFRGKIKITNFDYMIKNGDPIRLQIIIESSLDVLTIIEIYFYNNHTKVEISIENSKSNMAEDLRTSFVVKKGSNIEKYSTQLVQKISKWIIDNWVILKKDYRSLANKAQELNKKSLKSQISSLLIKNEDPVFGFADNLILHALDNYVHRGSQFYTGVEDCIDGTDKILWEILISSLINEPVKFNLINKYLNNVKKGIDFLIEHQIKNLLKRGYKFGYGQKSLGLTEEDYEEIADDLGISIEQIIYTGGEQSDMDWSNYCSIMGGEFFDVLKLIDTPTSNTYLKGLKNSRYIQILIDLGNRISDM